MIPAPPVQACVSSHLVYLSMTYPIVKKKKVWHALVIPLEMPPHLWNFLFEQAFTSSSKDFHGTNFLG